MLRLEIGVFMFETDGDLFNNKLRVVRYFSQPNTELLNLKMLFLEMIQLGVAYESNFLAIR